VSDYAFATIRNAFYNRRHPQHPLERIPGVDQHDSHPAGHHSTLKDSNGQRPLASGEMEISNSESESHLQQRIKMEQASDRFTSNDAPKTLSSSQKVEPASPAGGIGGTSESDQRTDSIRYIIESLVAAEVKRTNHQHLTAGGPAAINSMTLSAYDLPRNRAASLSLPKTETNYFDSTPGQFVTRPTTSTENYFTRVGDGKVAGSSGGVRSTTSTTDVGNNPTTAQLLQEARSYKQNPLNETVPVTLAGQMSSSKTQHHQLGATSNQSRAFPTSGTAEFSNSKSEIVSSGMNKTVTGIEASQLHDVASSMNKIAESNNHGLSDISASSRSHVGSFSASIPVVTSSRTHCVRDVCDAIIAQSFRDERIKRSPDHQERNSKISKAFGGMGRYAFSDGSRHSSTSAGSVVSAGADSPRSVSTTDDDKQSSIIAPRDRLPARLYNVDSPVDSSRSSSQRNGLTLKELMGSPAIARNYRFDGLGSQPSTNTTGDWPIANEAPRTERRRSEESASIANYLSDEGNVERRRNQTFSAGNSTSSTQNLERLVASAEARKQMLRVIHEKQQEIPGGIVAIKDEEKSFKLDVKLESKLIEPTSPGAPLRKSVADISPVRLDSLSSSDDDENGRYARRSRKLFIDETRKSVHEDDDSSKQSSDDHQERIPQQPSSARQVGTSPSTCIDSGSSGIGGRNIVQNSTRPLTRADSPQLL